MIDIVLITTESRPLLLLQTIESLYANSAPIEFKLTIVHDRPLTGRTVNGLGHTEIFNAVPQGASASRNIGASSIPRYRRRPYVLFLDDDVFMCSGWYLKLIQLIRNLQYHPSDAFDKGAIVSPYSHPFNHAEITYVHEWAFGIPLVISSVAMMMPWTVFDDVGPWDEPGGSGASEDYALCCRARDKGYGFAITYDHYALHCGVTSSNGKPIVGADLVMENNRRLEKVHGIVGKVRYE